MAISSAYKNQIEAAFDTWLDSPETRFRHKHLRQSLQNIRDTYRHEIGADEKTLAVFEREVKSVAHYHGIDYQVTSDFWELNAPLGDNPASYKEASGVMCFPDGCEIDIVYSRRKGKFDFSEAYSTSRLPATCDHQVAELTGDHVGMIATHPHDVKLVQTPERVVESLILNRANSPLLKDPLRKNNGCRLYFDDFLGYGSVLLDFCSDIGVSSDFVRYCLDEQAKETYGKQFVSILDLGVPIDLNSLAMSDYPVIEEAVKKQAIRTRAKEALANLGLNVDAKKLENFVDDLQLPC